MPRLTTKITVKLEPDLLKMLQSTAEYRGLTVSGCVREAVIRYIQEHGEEGGPRILKMNLSRFETRMAQRLINTGYFDSTEDLFHQAFRGYITGGLGETFEMAGRIHDLRPISITSHPLPSRGPFTENPFDRMEDEDENDEGDH